LRGVEPLFERILPGAFCKLNGVLEANVAHMRGARVATTWDAGLKVWLDYWGIAFSIDCPATYEGRGTKAMVETGGVRECSVGLIVLDARYSRDENGGSTETLSAQQLIIFRLSPAVHIRHHVGLRTPRVNI
jgi:phage head maturation protease